MDALDFIWYSSFVFFFVSVVLLILSKVLKSKKQQLREAGTFLFLIAFIFFWGSLLLDLYADSKEPGFVQWNDISTGKIEVVNDSR